MVRNTETKYGKDTFHLQAFYLADDNEDRDLWHKYVNGRGEVKSEPWSYVQAFWTLEELERSFAYVGENWVALESEIRPHKWGLTPSYMNPDDTGATAKVWLAFRAPSKETVEEILKDIPVNAENVKDAKRVLHRLRNAKKEEDDLGDSTPEPHPEVRVEMWCRKKPDEYTIKQVLNSIEHNCPFSETQWKVVSHDYQKFGDHSSHDGMFTINLELTWCRAILDAVKWDKFCELIWLQMGIAFQNSDLQIRIEVSRIPEPFIGADHYRLLQAAAQAYSRNDQKTLERILKQGSLEVNALQDDK